MLRTRRERPRRRRAAEQRDELAPFQFIELHSVPASQPGSQDIELQAVSQRVVVGGTARNNSPGRGMGGRGYRERCASDG